MRSESFPQADQDRLVVYLLGSGYGESQVVLLPGPERRCIVVDCCLADKGGENLTCALLSRLGIQKGQVDLLVITHADEDHIGGMCRLIDDFDPKRIWYSPFVESMRAYVSVWRGGKADDLSGVLTRINMLEGAEPPRARLAYVDARGWEGAPDGCVVEAIAPPASRDVEFSGLLYKMLERQEKAGWLVSNEGERVLDRSKALVDHANKLSIALSIGWCGHRLLLCGDVEKKEWGKVLSKLKDPLSPRMYLVTDVDLLKVAHHGSDGAFHGEAWIAHAKTEGGTTVLVAPFNRKAKLPDSRALGRLIRYSAHLGITRDVGGSFQRARDAGWVALEAARVHRLDGPPGICAVTLDRKGEQRFFAAPDACFFLAESTADDYFDLP